MIRRRDRHEEPEKVLDVDASMQGSLLFRDPVNLRINGRFEGTLNTKGNLMIGEHAVVNADIVGDSVVVAGKVSGNIHALKELKLISPATVVGDVRTPLLSVAEGSVLEGRCQMLASAKQESAHPPLFMTADELAKYLEIETSLVFEWANMGKIPAMKEGDAWRFDRKRIDEWVTTEKIR